MVGTDNSATRAGSWQIMRAPEFTGNIGVQYRTSEIGGIGEFVIYGGIYHARNLYYTEFKRPEVTKGYTVFNNASNVGFSGRQVKYSPVRKICPTSGISTGYRAVQLQEIRSFPTLHRANTGSNAR